MGLPEIDGASSGNYTGAAYVFKRNSNNVWELERMIEDQAKGFANLDSSDYFGSSVALDGDYLVAAARYDDGLDNYYFDSGAVYVFKQEEQSWNLNQKIANAPTIDNNTWQNFKTLNRTEPNCDSGDSLKFNNASTSASTVSLEASDHGKWLCFKVNNTNGIVSYHKRQINLTPTISLTQDQDSVDVVATAIPGFAINSSSWQYFKTTSSTAPSCDSSNAADFNVASSGNNSAPITSADNNKWICLRVADSNQTYGYIKHSIDYNLPVVSVEQINTVLTAATVATDLPTSPVWQKSGPFGSSNCDSNTSGFINGKTVSSATDNKYYCFKVSDKAGNVGYGEIQVDLTPPIINLRQNQKTVTMTTAGLTDVGYFVANINPDCSSFNTAAGLYQWCLCWQLIK